MPQSEGKWLEGARRLDGEVLGEIYDELSPELFRYAYRLLGQIQPAEDIMAEAFLRLLHAVQAGGGPETNLRAYMYRIIHNLAMDQHRRQPDMVQDADLEMEPSSEDNPLDQVERSLSQEQARAILWRLTPAQRQVILLKFFQGLTNEDIAAVVEKPVGAVKALQHRALNALRRALKQEHGWNFEGR